MIHETVVTVPDCVMQTRTQRMRCKMTTTTTTTMMTTTITQQNTRKSRKKGERNRRRKKRYKVTISRQQWCTPPPANIIYESIQLFHIHINTHTHTHVCVYINHAHIHFASLIRNICIHTLRNPYFPFNVHSRIHVTYTNARIHTHTHIIRVVLCKCE